jgi:electron transfer flavoprotein beta subunit
MTKNYGHNQMERMLQPVPSSWYILRGFKNMNKIGVIPMSRVVVCYKWVADEADIKINADLSVDTCKASGKISDYDKNAIEAAVQASAAMDGQAVGLTFGNGKAKKSLKDALSRGLAEGYFINGEEALTADGAATARALAGVLKKIEDIALIICAEGASDTYARQTAPRLGAMLNLPVITSVSYIKISGKTLTVVRKLDDCLQTVKTELPAVISVLPEINPAPIPGLKAVLAAGKKTVTELSTADLGVDLTPKTRITRIKGYVMDRKNLILKEGETDEKVTELISALRKEGVL